MLYQLASKIFWTGPPPGSSVPAGTSPETPEQIIYHSKALHACNPTVGHSSRLVEYEESYAHLNFSIFLLFQGYSHLFSLITPFRGLFRGCPFCPAGNRDVSGVVFCSLSNETKISSIGAVWASLRPISRTWVKILGRESRVAVGRLSLEPQNG